MLSTACVSSSSLISSSRSILLPALALSTQWISRPYSSRRRLLLLRTRSTSRAMSTSTAPDSPISVFQTLEQLREWRNKAFAEKKSVGLVPTMGALHDGHLSLVRRSLQDNDLTVVSIFVNPTQFAPHEDLESYPRTLPQDLAALSVLTSPPPHERTTAAVFVPSVQAMYPPTPETSSFFYSPHSHVKSTSTSTSKSQSQSDQEFVHEHRPEIGTFVEVVGLGTTLEGRSRPHFFRGVATVVTKLFNATQPTHAYFGQKDIQQALLLRRLSRDLLLSYPTPETLHIVPTARAEEDNTNDIPAGLALSSRNAYLSRTERAHAPVLYRALLRAQAAWEQGLTKSTCIRAAVDLLEMEELVATENGVHLKVDYVEMSDPWTFESVPDIETRFSGESEERPFVLSAAIWVGGTRLIDNIILGDSKKVLY